MLRTSCAGERRVEISACAAVQIMGQSQRQGALLGSAALAQHTGEAQAPKAATTYTTMAEQASLEIPPVSFSMPAATP